MERSTSKDAAVAARSIVAAKVVRVGPRYERVVSIHTACSIDAKANFVRSWTDVVSMSFAESLILDSFEECRQVAPARCLPRYKSDVNIEEEEGDDDRLHDNY